MIVEVNISSAEKPVYLRTAVEDESSVADLKEMIRGMTKQGEVTFHDSEFNELQLTDRIASIEEKDGIRTVSVNVEFRSSPAPAPAAPAAASTTTDRQPETDGRLHTTPAIQRKRHNPKPSCSPGQLLDDAEDKQVLKNNLDRYCREMIEEMPRGGGQRIEVPSIESLRKYPQELGEFANVHLPYTRNEIDMRIDFEQWPASPAAVLTREIFMVNDKCSNVLLVGKSGCGKTSSIFHAAQGRYCILFTASSNKEEGVFTRRDPGGFDTTFAVFVEDVRRIVSSTSTSKDNMESQSNHSIVALIIARMLVLRSFRKLGGCPLAWLMYQLTENYHRVATEVYRSLSKRTDDVLDAIKEIISRKGKDFFFAFDEAQYGYELLKDRNVWESTSKPGEYRGIACPFLRTLSRFDRSIVVAGTALSLLSIESCRSDIGKPQAFDVVDQFQPVSLVEITSKLQGILKMNTVDMSKADLEILEGRGRLLGGLFSALAEEHKKDRNQQKLTGKKAKTKQDLFEDTVRGHYRSCLNALVPRIERAFVKEEKCPLSNERTRRIPGDISGEFELLAIASLIGNEVSISRKKVNVDLLHIGLCSVRTVETMQIAASNAISDDNVEFVLDECLSRAAVMEVAQKIHFTTDLVKRATSLNRAGVGNSMEPLIVSEFHHLSSNGPVKVRDFLEQASCGELPPNLPDWINNACLSVVCGVTRAGYKRKRKEIESDVDYIREALNNRQLQNTLLSPSTIKRPDYEAVQGDGNMPWFLSISSKSSAKLFDDRDCSDYRSTDPNLFYTKKDGNENPQCCHLRREWVEVLNEHKDVFSRCLRIHVCLPDVQRPGGNLERIFVDEGTIVLYITSRNIRNVFREDFVAVLERLGSITSNEQNHDG